SELLKLTFAIYLASWLEKKKYDMKNLYTAFVPFVIMISVVAVFLVMQPDIGTLFVVIATSVALYFVGGGKISQIFGVACIGLISLALLVQIAPYRLNRFLVFLHPELDPKGIGYQINQAFIAIGSGGFSGLGFGKSIQKYNYLPEPTGDSVFAIVTEETGFVGAAFLIFLFLIFFWRGMYIARRAPDRFGTLLAAGVVSGITAQAFINMAAISGLLPLTGIPLPFISYGGTSLVITLASIGAVLNVSKHH
ncbi:FtsW/RodA/SpoVE family cell cycle protein, partial [Patescibacteria group bacterium]|nr:FtsW/RodA/SpoVE family cell cycle protein [Patescibacteria group bacterium]